MRNNKFKLTTLAASLMLASGSLMADDHDARAIAERLVDEHFQDSTLSREEQIEELLWFAKAAEPFRGMDIQTVAEGLTTHVYESSWCTHHRAGHFGGVLRSQPYRQGLCPGPHLRSTVMSWMVWTTPTAIFFSSIAAMLAGMTLWEILSPTVERKGFLPISTTRGDRLFIGLLSAAFIHLGVIGFTTLSIWIALALSAVWLLVLMRWG